MIFSSPEGLKAWLYVGIFCIFTCLIIVWSMFFPGMTLGQFLGDISVVPGEYPLLLALTLITQGLILRYFQGVESRKLMNSLNEYHLSVLKDDLLPKVSRVGPGDLPELKREFLLFIMNKLLVQEFFYRFYAQSASGSRSGRSGKSLRRRARISISKICCKKEKMRED